jgi:hypothetical protein
VGENIVDGPLAGAPWTVQSSSRQICGKSGDLIRLLSELSQDLVDREWAVVHRDKCCMAGSPLAGADLVSRGPCGGDVRLVARSVGQRPPPGSELMA